jgi:hypothetical protein
MDIVDPKVPDKVDPLALGILLAVALAAGLTFLSDHFLFIKEPPNWILRMVSLPTLVAYNITDDRVMSDVATFIVYVALGFAIGFNLVRLYALKILKPRMIREMLADQKLHKKILNESGADEVM